eukprot:jgi/Ulvmu1/2331/UM013_0179.1
MLAGGGPGDAAVPGSAAFREYTFRATVIYGVMVAQVYRDAPRTIRTMAVNSSHALLKYCKVENMHEQLYRGLGLSVADLWQAWERRRRSLNKPHAAALAALRALPGPDALSTEILSACMRTADPRKLSQHAQQASQSSTTPEHLSRGHNIYGGGGMHELHAWGDKLKMNWAGARPSGTDRVGDLPCVGLLGECHAAAGAAMHALRDLAAVHTADGDLYAENVDLQCQPDAVLSLEKLCRVCYTVIDQLCRVCCAHLEHVVAQADFLALCQLAAAQRSRDRMFRKPPMFVRDAHADTGGRARVAMQCDGVVLYMGDGMLYYCGAHRCNLVLKLSALRAPQSAAVTAAVRCVCLEKRDI